MKRLPVAAVAVWTASLAALVALGLAVAHYLSGTAGMAGMSHGGASAWVRGGGNPVGGLLGRRLLTAWQVDALALIMLVLLTAWYLTAVALRAIRSSGPRWPITRTLLFLLGVAVTAYATSGAIAVYDQALFTAHMAGHLALVMLAPALLVAGRPLRLAIESSTPSRAARIERIVKGRVVTAITCPPVALVTYTVVIVGSHLTGLMDVFMRNTWAGQLEHLVYLLAGLQFFVLIVGDEPIRWRLASPVRWLLLALAMAVDTFTGIVLMQLSEPITMRPVPGLDVNALSDTHTGGAIMWFGGDGLMAVVMVTLVLAWLRRVDSTTPDEKGWLEQARRATFAEHTGAQAPEAEIFDADDAARAAYNQWLSGLEKHQ